MLYTKSLYVNYASFPKLGWWKANNKEVYYKIKKMETEEKQEHAIELWQSVEDKVLEYLEAKHHTTASNLFPAFPKQTENGEGESEDIVTQQQDWLTKLQSAAADTLEAIKNKEPLLYQPSFLWNDCFVRADFMVLNSEWNYDLIEVKAKTTIRKNVKDDGEDKPIGDVKKDLIDDVSFQTYVINNVLKENDLWELWGKYLYHLNKEYVKKWELDINQLITFSKLDTKHTIAVLQWKKKISKEKLINDSLVNAQIVEETLGKLKKEIHLSEEDFNKLHMYPWVKYLEYFGEDKPFGTIMWRGIHHGKAKLIHELYYDGSHNIDELTEEEIMLFHGKDAPGTSYEFINNYLVAKEQGKPLIDEISIHNDLKKLTYPICFYDYETISVPIPYMDNTSPYQQVVVQYSLHKYYEDGSMKHYGWLLWWLEESKRVETITIENNPNKVWYESEKVVYGSYKDLLDEFLIDIGEDINDSSFVVWYQAFENTRNKEIANLFPDIADSYQKMREEGTYYDLMDIFAKSYYFDLAFEWSSSIKKVLPVLVPEMTYEWMEIWKGDEAMKALNNLLIDKYSGEEKRKVIENLLLYCGQDSLAMVRLFEKIRLN